ncbi:MAG TPA: apolipoprotein N-acyltransferase [Caulobacteraceae bacterium]|nr:apolipoprotein N-acyltransferase [Caulobacteraceae bacterium]
MTTASRAWALRGAAVAAGLAPAFANQPFGFLPGLLGYAVLLRLLDRADPRRPLRSAFLRGWLAGLAYFVASVWWIGEAFFVHAREQGWMAPFAVGALAALMAVSWGGAAALYRGLAPANAWRLLVFAGAVTAFEWLRGHVLLLTGFPWDLAGETWKAGSAPSQAASLFGAYGLSWITVAIAAAPGLGVRTRGARIGLCLAAAALAGLYGFGLWRLAAADDAPAPGAPLVRIVQPDTPVRALYDAAAFDDIARRNLELTTRPAPRRPDIIVWSEQGLPASFNEYLAPGTWTRRAIEAALQPGQTLLSGGYRVETAPPGAYAPDGYLYFNSLIALTRSAAGLSLTATYDKHYLVAFGEYLPLDRFLTPLGVKQLVHVGDGFTPGPAPRPISPPGIPPLQPLICYESLFSGVTRDGAQASGLRPAWILNISDDAWFGRTIGPWQHLNLASYRSIEEGLPMVRGTPTGLSAVIDAEGRLEPGKLLGLGAFGVIDARLPPALPPTIFDRWGKLLFLGMLLVSLGAYAQGLDQSLRRPGGAGRAPSDGGA